MDPFKGPTMHLLRILTVDPETCPFTVSIGLEKYPDVEEVFKEIHTHAKLYPVYALHIAKEAGASIAKNIVLLGALAATDLLPFKADLLLKTVLENVPAKYKEINKKAFEGGMKALKKL